MTLRLEKSYAESRPEVGAGRGPDPNAASGWINAEFDKGAMGAAPTEDGVGFIAEGATAESPQVPGVFGLDEK